MNIWSRMEQESLVITIPAQVRGAWTEEEKEAYERYTAVIYEKYRLRITPFERIKLSRNGKRVYFNESRLLPHFRQYGYEIKLVEGLALDQALHAVKAGSLVLIAVMDDGSQTLHQDGLNLQPFGIRLNRNHLRHSYLWAAQKDTQGAWQVLREQISEQTIRLSSSEVEEGALPVTFEMTSGGALSGNECEIVIDGEPVGPLSRGMNVVAIDGDTKAVKLIQADTFATPYCSGSWYAAVPPIRQEREEERMDAAIAHALGRIDSVAYTNCKEALQQAYEAGFRIFEVDLLMTSDGQLVARHDWQPYLYDYLQQTPPEPNDGQPLTFEHVMALPILGKYTPLSFADLLTFMQAHPSVRIVTDTKSTARNEVVAQFSKIYDESRIYGSDVVDRIIPQLYSPQMQEWLQAIYAGWDYFFTLYQYQGSDEEVLAFTQKQGIAAVVMSLERFQPEFARNLRSQGIKVILHTINDRQEMERYVGAHADGIMTDELAAADIRRASLRYEAEASAYYEAIRLYVQQVLQAPDTLMEAIERKYKGRIPAKQAVERIFALRSRKELESLLEE